MKEVGIIAVLSMILIGLLVPERVGTILLKVNLLAIAAYGGYWVDRLSSRPARRPHLLVGVDRSMAEQRRCWIICACMLSMALGL